MPATPDPAAVDTRSHGVHAAWCVRHVGLGFAVGLVFGAASQLLVALAGSSAAHLREPSVAQRVAGVLFTTIGYALVALLAGAVSGTWLRWAVGRAAAVAFSAALLTGLFVFHVVGVLVRVLSGTYLTTGAIEFVLNSREHFLHAAVETYSHYGAALVIASALFAAGIYAFLRRGVVPLTGRRVPARLIGVGSGLSGVFALAFVPLPRLAFVEGMWLATPELALLGSMDRRAAPAVLDDAETDAPEPEPGPPLAAESLWAAAARVPGARRPNVLLLTLESIALGHLGYEGYPRGATPNLDRIAARSARFRRAYTTATHSNYAQMAILSSLFPRRGSMLDQYSRLDYPRFLAHDLFQGLGHRTATISSQDETWQGMRRFQDTGTPTLFVHSPDYGGEHIDTGAERVVPDHETTRLAIEWLGKAKGKPWQLYLNLQMTHFPYRIPEGAPRRFHPVDPEPSTFTFLGYPQAETAVVVNRYDNALAYVDAQIGRIEAHLHDTGQLGRTIWVITADHGEAFHEHGVVTHGQTLRDPEARVPLLVHWPDGVPPGDFDEPVSHLDVLPTLAELAGVPPHPSWQGRSLAAVAEGREHAGDDPRPGVFLNIQGMAFADALVCWPYKLIIDRTARRLHLYDLDRDPEELVDRSEGEPGIAALLAATLQAQMEAQLEYHGESWARRHRYAPRMLSCPP